MFFMHINLQELCDSYISENEYMLTYLIFQKPLMPLACQMAGL